MVQILQQPQVPQFVVKVLGMVKEVVFGWIIISIQNMYFVPIVWQEMNVYKFVRMKQKLIVHGNFFFFAK